MGGAVVIRHRVRPRLIAPVVARPLPPSLRLAPVFLRAVEERPLFDGWAPTVVSTFEVG